jgi:hypothetical protein
MSTFYSINEISDSGGNFINLYIDKDEVDNTALKVLEYDTPNHIMPFAVIHNRDEILLKYDISNLEKIETLSGCIKAKRFIELLTKLCNLMCNCKYWFLKSENFIFRKKYVFYNRDQDQFQMIYLPIKNNNKENKFKELLLYLLEKIEKDEGNKLKIKILQQMVSPNFNAHKLQNFLKRYSKTVTNEKMQRVVKTSSEKIVNKDLKRKETNKKSKKKNRFLSWLFKTEPIKVGETIEKYKDKHFQNKHYLELVENNTIYKVVEIIELKFLDDTFLIGKKGEREKESLLKFNLNNKISDISHIHLKFIRHKDGLKVVDLDSSSGTFINSKRLKPREVVEIREGDNIAISPKVVYQLKTNER